jgi:hypothetical protein
MSFFPIGNILNSNFNRLEFRRILVDGIFYRNIEFNHMCR